eukprot:TRINITY_DN10428_c0_g1_i2.p1 TRINITY_DN10428_c0_g1~~TRINITY_DN10428_c0_g1_i2.p1  ORF type:complete len:235 (+),score=73.44 TRINITY_DN10428_c0_g1_i2:61-705(+)
MKSAANVVRKTWDTAEYAKKAAERKIREEQNEKSKKTEKKKMNFPALKPDTGSGAPRREYLSARDTDLEIDENIGKKTLQQGEGEAASAQGGFYCDTCDMNFKDSLSFVSHKNGKKHQKMLGVSMVVAKSSLTDVKSKFALLKAQKDLDDAGRTRAIEDRMRKRQLEWEQDEEKKKLARRNAKKQKKERERNENTEEIPEDDEMMRVMGFSSFK